MKKYLIFIIILLTIAIAGIFWLFSRNSNRLVERYGVILRSSTSGDMRFNYFDIEKGETVDNYQGYPWFFATIEDINDKKKVDDYYNYVENNEKAVFKITGIKEKDDCDYYGNGTCLESIMVKEIEAIEN